MALNIYQYNLSNAIKPNKSYHKTRSHVIDYVINFFRQCRSCEPNLLVILVSVYIEQTKFAYANRNLMENLQAW